jgi:hypothetical protein
MGGLARPSTRLTPPLLLWVLPRHSHTQNVYDKQCDVSLILKSVVLHMAQLTQLSVEQEGQATAKAMAAMAELPLLTHLSVRTRQG